MTPKKTPQGTPSATARPVFGCPHCEHLLKTLQIVEDLLISPNYMHLPDSRKIDAIWNVIEPVIKSETGATP